MCPTRSGLAGAKIRYILLEMSRHAGRLRGMQDLMF